MRGQYARRGGFRGERKGRDLSERGEVGLAGEYNARLVPKTPVPAD